MQAGLSARWSGEGETGCCHSPPAASGLQGATRDSHSTRGWLRAEQTSCAVHSKADRHCEGVIGTAAGGMLTLTALGCCCCTTRHQVHMPLFNTMMQVQMQLLLVPHAAAHLHWCWFSAAVRLPPRTVRQCLRAGCRREPRPTPDCPAVPAADSLGFKDVEAQSQAS